MREQTWLLIGPASLLTGTPLTTGETLVLARVPTPPGPRPANTIILKWDELAATTVLALTPDGTIHHRIDDVDGIQLVDRLRLAEPVQALLSNTGAIPENFAPLLVLTTTRATAATQLHAYSQIRRSPDDACFLRITDTDQSITAISDLEWLPAVLAIHANHAPGINTHDIQYRNPFPGWEMEYKLALPPDADTWSLASETYSRLWGHELPEFAPKYRDELERWDSINYLFQVSAGDTADGYVSFRPADDGTYILKRKRFTRDAVSRLEHTTKGLAIDGPLTDYVRDHLKLQARQLPAFRRIRYDLNIESTRTGDIFALVYDRCHLLEQPTTVLAQAEIEYISTRTVLDTYGHEIKDELERLARWVQSLLGDRGIDTAPDVYSKLSWLKHVSRDLAGVRVWPVTSSEHASGLLHALRSRDDTETARGSSSSEAATAAPPSSE